MESNQKPCRHEYVKIFQRKYKDFGRRIVSTRGYLPTGFTNKDFAFLSSGAFCFCVNCRKRLFPNRAENKAATIQNPVLVSQPVEVVDNIWAEESSATTQTTSQEIDVEELQIETIEVTDLLDTSISANVKEEVEEEGDE